jgi:Asp-tRNA(Asn)/Glu-tRNA(Gln) amidotransferase A subunit family amidase
MLTAYRTGALSPVEVTRSVLARIEAVNQTINAICFVDAERSVLAARESETRWRRGAPAGPLDGVPVTLKDGISAHGTVSFFGSNATDEAGSVDAFDAPVAARLREAGAIILAKTTMPDFGLIASGISSRYGVTRNPWNLTRNSGGSSSGAAAALAAGCGPLAVGTDGGGSVRIPSAFCGVFGLKPSYGRVPMHDPSPWRVTGPMTRDVMDAALMMNVMTMPDARDYSSLPYDDKDYRDGICDGVRGTRIGVLEDIGFGLKVDPAVREKLLRAAALFEDLGAIVDPVPPIFAADPEPVFDHVVHIHTYLLFATMSEEQKNGLLPVLAEWCRRENDGSKQQLMQALVDVGPIRRAILAPFATHDFLLAPVMAILPYEAELAWPPAGTAHNPFCFPFNMSEQPAASIHGGFSRDGLPVGLQIIGRRFGDRDVLRAAYAHALATGCLGQRPPL